MISGFLIKKGHMTSVYTPDGKRIAVTKCIAKPLIVTQIKNKEKDEIYKKEAEILETQKSANEAIFSEAEKTRKKLLTSTNIQITQDMKGEFEDYKEEEGIDSEDEDDGLDDFFGSLGISRPK